MSSQANSLLYLLLDRERHSSYSLMDKLYGGHGGRLAARVQELRKRGWIIPNAVKDSVNPKMCWYTLSHFRKTEKSLPVDIRLADDYHLTFQDVQPKPIMEESFNTEIDYVPYWQR